MKLEELFLRKEELPILHKSCFQIPIHPKLLDEKLNIDKEIAHKIFLQVADDWYDDLSRYVETENLKIEELKWIKEVYLLEKPKIEKRFNSQIILGCWEDRIQTRNNGFVDCFLINRDFEGSLYFDEEDDNCKSFGKSYIKFSEEKFKEFEFERIGNYQKILTYASHNIDNYPGALFLRNWAIQYMNNIFEKIF